MLDCQKHLFNIPKEVAYLNCAYMSPLAEPVELAGYQGLARKILPYEIAPIDFFNEVDVLKKAFSALINAGDPERVAVIPSVSYGVANAVRNVKLEYGQNIVLVEEIFPSNYYAWERLAKENGGEIRIINGPPAGQGRGPVINEKLLEAIDSSTAAVALPPLHWADGTLLDLVAIRKKTLETGSLLIIDGTQAVGAMPFDVQEIRPDALICAGYKWLLGPYGIGLAYYGERFDGGTPIEESWMNRLHSENFDQLVRYQPEYKPKANRYSVGEFSQFVHVPMLIASLDLIAGWGMENIQSYCRRLSAPFIKELVNMGCRLEDEQWCSAHIIGLRLPEGIDLQVFKEKARQQQVYVSVRGGSLRIAPHVYNDEKDFERLMGVFKSVF